MTREERWGFPGLQTLTTSHKVWKLGSAFILPLVGMFSKVMCDCFNVFSVHNRDVLVEALEKRDPRTPLITVSNHHSCLDDPVLWGILDWKHLFNSHLMRWTAAAQDICFTNAFHSTFFSLGKTFAICRGDGVYQYAMDFSVNLMNSGVWVHFFPEGKVNLLTKDLPRLKWGVGRLIAESKKCPIVIPFWHVGMDTVLPNKEPYIPRLGQAVTVLFGNPIHFQDLRERLRQDAKTVRDQRQIFTNVIQDEMLNLKSQAERLHEVHLRNINESLSRKRWLGLFHKLFPMALETEHIDKNIPRNTISQDR